MAAAPNWPTVTATISDSRVVPCSKGARHAPEVKYTYSVNGTSHDGEVRFKYAHCGEIPAAQAIVAAYPVTYTLLIHVDPQDPSISFVQSP